MQDINPEQISAIARRLFSEANGHAHTNGKVPATPSIPVMPSVPAMPVHPVATPVAAPAPTIDNGDGLRAFVQRIRNSQYHTNTGCIPADDPLHRLLGAKAAASTGPR